MVDAAENAASPEAATGGFRVNEGTLSVIVTGD